MIRAILACDDQWGIGRDNNLPWPHNSHDLQWFKECTDGDVIVMGRRTWESLPRRPLPNRENVVITSGDVTGADVTGDMNSILKILPQMNYKKNIWIIGGASIFQQLIPYMDEIWLSRIDGVYDCDTHLPHQDITAEFTVGEMTVDENLTIEKWIRN